MGSGTAGDIIKKVKAALERVEAREILRVRIHPDYQAALRQMFSEMNLPQRIEVDAVVARVLSVKGRVDRKVRVVLDVDPVSML